MNKDNLADLDYEAIQEMLEVIYCLLLVRKSKVI